VTRRKKEPQDWLRDQLSQISSIGKAAARIRPGVTHDYGEHTALKLAALNHALSVFTDVAWKYVHVEHWYRSLVYVDLFAGCGVTRTPKGRDFLAGSPLLAASTRRPFDRMVLVEKDEGLADVLRQRLAPLPLALAPSVLAQDCNKPIAGVDGADSSRDLVFVAVDPEGLEFDWDRLVAISERFPAADFFFNFTAGTKRVLAAATAAGRESPALRRATGLTVRQVLDSAGGDAAQAFEGQIREVLGKKFGGTSTIYDRGGNPIYNLMLYSRQTRGGSLYAVRGYGAIHTRLEGLRADDVDLALNTVKARRLEDAAERP
jgi:three-Cys-motif partner protein